MKLFLGLLALMAVLKCSVANHCDKNRIDQIIQGCAEVHGITADWNLITIISNSTFVNKLCTNLGCFLECFQDPLSLCRFNETKSLMHDHNAYGTTFKYICKNATDAATIYQTCQADIQSKESQCRNDLDPALTQAETNLTSTNDTSSYKTVVCQAYSDYRTCMTFSNSSTCSEHHVQKINTIVHALYSRSECGTTPGLSYNNSENCDPYTYPNGLLNTVEISNACSINSCSPSCVSFRMFMGCFSEITGDPLESKEALSSLCSKSDCMVDCMNGILTNCSYNEPWFIHLDPTARLAYMRHLCQNITFTMEASNCIKYYQSQPCLISSTVSDYINVAIKYNNGGFDGFRTALCRSYAYIKQCWHFETSSSCTDSQANFYLEMMQMIYSLLGCNDTTPLMQRYNMKVSCTSNTTASNNTVNCTDYCSTGCLTNRMTSSCLSPYNISQVDIFEFINVRTHLDSYCGNLDCILDCLDTLLAECERSSHGPWLMQFDRIAYQSAARLVCDNVTKTALASMDCYSSLMSGLCWSTLYEAFETALLTAYSTRDEQGYVSAMCKRYSGRRECLNLYSKIYCSGESSEFMINVTNSFYSLALCNVSSPVSGLFNLEISCGRGNSSGTTGSCNSTLDRVTRCLASYQLGSFPYGSNLTNLQHLCSNLDCTLDCLRNATEGVSYYCSVEYDNTTLITLYRFLCDNVSLTVSATNNCATYFQALQMACQPLLNDSLKVILSAFQKSSDENIYVMDTCSAKVNFTNCMKLPIDGSLSTCTVEEAKLYNHALNATNSFSVCGLISPLVNVYDMNTYCGVVSSLPTTTSPSTTANSTSSTLAQMTTTIPTSPAATSTITTTTPTLRNETSTHMSTSSATTNTTNTTENSLTCTSVKSDISHCLTRYNLTSYNLTEYVYNAVTICGKLECIMNCIKTAVDDCYKNNTLYLTYDIVALITTYRYMCDSFNETLQAFRECASEMQTKASVCFHNLSIAMAQAESNYVTDKHKANYLNTMCSGISTYTTCVTISASGNCRATFVLRINTVQRSWYSYYQCGVTSELYATYYQDPVCALGGAEGTIYGHSLIHIGLLLGSLCFLYFFKH